MARIGYRYILLLIAIFAGLFLLNIISSFIFGYSQLSRSSSPSESTRITGDTEAPYRNKNVRLFAATSFFGKPIDNSFLRECSVKEYCKLVNDFESADAVIYHAPDYRFFSTSELKPNQISVIWSLESPINHRFSPDLKGRINWTMTYRRDADVWFPYGVVKKREKPIPIDYDKIWRDKKRMAVWLISNCDHTNGRIALAHALQKSGLELDIFGACGQHKTPNDCDGVHKQGDRCVSELFMPYMFALSFENSLCKDYITEKFFEVLQKRYAIPIVMQRKRYEHIAAPPNSFIAIDDYKDIDELINDIKTIANNKFTYLKYHRWREWYEEYGCKCLIVFRSRVLKHLVIAKKSQLDAPTSVESISEIPQELFDFDRHSNSANESNNHDGVQSCTELSSCAPLENASTDICNGANVPCSDDCNNGGNTEVSNNEGDHVMDHEDAEVKGDFKTDELKNTLSNGDEKVEANISMPSSTESNNNDCAMHSNSATKLTEMKANVETNGYPALCKFDKHTDQHFMGLPVSWDGAPEFQWRIISKPEEANTLIIENAVPADLLSVWMYPLVLRAEQIITNFRRSPGNEMNNDAIGSIRLLYSDNQIILSCVISYLVYVRTPNKRRLKIYLPQSSLMYENKDELQTRLGRVREPLVDMRQLLLKPIDEQITEQQILNHSVLKNYPSATVELKTDASRERFAIVTYQSAELTIAVHSMNNYIPMQTVDGDEKWLKLRYANACSHLMDSKNEADKMQNEETIIVQQMKVVNDEEQLKGNSKSVQCEQQLKKTIETTNNSKQTFISETKSNDSSMNNVNTTTKQMLPQQKPLIPQAKTTSNNNSKKPKQQKKSKNRGKSSKNSSNFWRTTTSQPGPSRFIAGGPHHAKNIPSLLAPGQRRGGDFAGMQRVPTNYYGGVASARYTDVFAANALRYAEKDFGRTPLPALTRRAQQPFVSAPFNTPIPQRIPAMSSDFPMRLDEPRPHLSYSNNFPSNPTNMSDSWITPRQRREMGVQDPERSGFFFGSAWR